MFAARFKDSIAGNFQRVQFSQFLQMITYPRKLNLRKSSTIQCIMGMSAHIREN